MGYTAAKVPPPKEKLKFKGKCDYPPENQVDDWGLTQEDQESYIELFRQTLASKNAWNGETDDYYKLRRFLRARSYDLQKATIMWMNNVAWKKEHQVETILQTFDFPEREAVLQHVPMGYHKTDKLGRPVYIQLLGKIDLPNLKKVSTIDRMLRFHIYEYERCVKVVMPVVSKIAGRHIDTTFGIMDVKGVGLGHLTGEIRQILGIVTKWDQDNYPETLGHIVIINAPAVFRVLWNMVKHMIDVRTQSKIDIVGSNYMETLKKYVDIESLPDWLGGKSKGSLADDKGPWNDPEVVARLGLDVQQLAMAGQAQAAAAPAAPPAVAVPAENGHVEEQPRALPSPTTPSAAPSPPLALDQQVVLPAAAASTPQPQSLPPLPQVQSPVMPSPAHSVVSPLRVSTAGGAAVLGARANGLMQRAAQVNAALLAAMGPQGPASPPAAATAAKLRSHTDPYASSVASASEGSLLHRMEALEHTMDSVLTALEALVALQQQQQQQR